MSSIRPLTRTVQKALSALNRAQDPKAQMKAVATIQAGFGALEAQVMQPELFLTRLAFSYQVPMALGTVVDQGIAEILGDKSLSSGEIEAKCGLPSGKVSRLLRLLAGRGVFREVRPDVWANTAVSKKLDSGLTIEEIKADPLGRYATGGPMTAWIQFTTEIGGLAAAAMIPAFREKKRKEATSITETPFNYAFKTDLPVWQWLEEADDGSRVRAFAKAMELNNTRSTNWGVYNWSALGEDATLVDVGGGVGSAMAAILSVAPNVKKVVIQDREPVPEKARSYWKAENPAAVEEGKVEFQVHDFFEEQPIKGESVYFLRHIMHDWSDDDCIKILEELHNAASSDSRLIIVDAVINYACHNNAGPGEVNVERVASKPWPAPLPANGGRATELDLLFDLHMMTMLNGQERTYAQFKDLAKQAGWKSKRVYETGNHSSLKILEFVKQ